MTSAARPIKSRKVQRLQRLSYDITKLRLRLDRKRAEFTRTYGTLTGTQLGEWDRVAKEGPS